MSAGPIRGALTLVSLYVLSSAVLWIANATFIKLEFPWTWYWLLFVSFVAARDARLRG